MSHDRCSTMETHGDARPTERLHLHQIFDARLNERERRLLAMLDTVVARRRRESPEPDAR